MSVLDPPLEALALKYLSCGVLTAAVNNIWAWIAVLTAAVSFWKLRALSSPIPAEQGGSSQDNAPSAPPLPEVAAVETAAKRTTIVSSPGEITKNNLLSAPTTSSCCVIESECISPKGKFSLYYKEDDFIIGGNDDHGGGEDECDGGGSGGGAVVMSEKVELWGDDWERMTMVVKMGDMGWYRCQDLKVLDGSVVRLWGCRRRRSAAAALAADCGVTW